MRRTAGFDQGVDGRRDSGAGGAAGGARRWTGGGAELLLGAWPGGQLVCSRAERAPLPTNTPPRPRPLARLQVFEQLALCKYKGRPRECRGRARTPAQGVFALSRARDPRAAPPPLGPSIWLPSTNTGPPSLPNTPSTPIPDWGKNFDRPCPSNPLPPSQRPARNTHSNPCPPLAQLAPTLAQTGARTLTGPSPIRTARSATTSGSSTASSRSPKSTTPTASCARRS